MKLYDLAVSGNCYKVRLFAALAQIELELVAVDFSRNEHKSEAIFSLNPWGQVPILQDDALVLRDAQAILVYLAGRYGGEAWWPGEAHLQGQVMQWLSVAANEIQHGPSAARLIKKFGANLDAPLALRRSEHILGLIDEHLATHQWLAAGRPTIAECAVFPYVALAWEGDVDISPYQNIAAWIARIKALPGFIAMPGVELAS
ncbi:glutathione S-transferase family protein [Bowmanella yangjiangensis]|uniref:Glutathione S-transferase n=1 Tax=Bowmanella yangjiangensis TaxID=2811230 RepID=A0ABS3CSK9_9ALTE|nr:glutathione S-transferase [Bowmanella yangjiangensis]MBN7820099.1 glutathione S-transferase [Bowmanella yangjiangensis]